MITVVVEANKINKDENRVVIDNLADINHIKNVFRKTINDEVRVVDGKNEYSCRIEKIEKKEIVLKIFNINENNFTTDTEIDAGICLIKNEKMDLTIQKLTELGIRRIIPIAAKRSVVKIDKKKDKWDIIVKEALKQCQGVYPTLIEEVLKISDIDYSFYDLIIVPYECEEKEHLKYLFKKLEKKPKKILFIIGPEGGFDKDEINYLKSKNAEIISLGKRILRAETAAIVTGGVLINEFQ